MKFISIGRKRLLTLSCILFVMPGFCQTLYPPKIQSPNAASTGTFGNTPVNLFTGTPDISIPIYALSYGRINVPITLNYNPAIVKPAQQPGWVGSGWDLQCGGSITRHKHGELDELLVPDDMSSDVNLLEPMSYYPAPPGYGRSGLQPGSYYANLSNWSSSSQLAQDFAYTSFNDPVSGLITQSPGLDPEADEFSFNVLGHSGKFYYEGSTNGWKVISNENIQVTVTDFDSPSEIINGISEHINNGPYNAGFHPSPSSAYQSQMFGSFTLTMPDGTKFIFGGKHLFTPPPGFIGSGNAPDAVELTSPRGVGASQSSSFYDLVFEINTWYLKTIIDPDGNQINYSYVNSYPTVNKYYQADHFSGTATNSGGFQSYSGGQNYDQYTLNEMDQWPVYLSQISSPNEIVKFNFSTASCNRYTQNQFLYANFYYTFNDPNTGVSSQLEGALFGFNYNYGTDYTNNIQWQQLNNITITDNPNTVGLYQNTPKVINKFGFTYNNNSSQRLMLGAFNAMDVNSNIVKSYTFAYNSDFVTQTPALHADGNYTDHWGYYNGTALPSNNSFSSINLFKAPNPNVSTTELLNKITYPTGGSTLLSWESNDYHEIVSNNRTSLVPWSLGVFGDYSLISNNDGTGGGGGGNRIAEIKNVASNGTTLTDTKYYYKSGYSNGASLSSLNSSGVLNGDPIYTFSYSYIPGVNGVYNFSGGGSSMYSCGNYGYTGEGSPVGYKEVAEVNSDGSYTRHLFSNFDADYNGVTHWDQPIAGSIGWNGTSNATMNYFPCSSLEVERGKPIATFEYKSDNTLLRKTVFTYRSDATRFNNYINLIEKRNDFFAKTLYYSNGAAAVPNDLIVLGSATKVFTYTYYPVSKITTNYDQSGNNPLIETENYTSYNNSNLLKTKTFVNSKGETITTNYQYPNDFTGTPYPSMVAANIIDPVVQTTVTNLSAGSSTQQLVSMIIKNYTQPFSSSVFVPNSLQVQVGGNTPETREQVNLFDAKGHPLEVQKPNGVLEAYVWGVNSEHILAKVVGAHYSSAIGLVTPSVLNAAGFTNSLSSDITVRGELNKIRTGLSGALVTTYTYAIGVGYTSETDPAGRTTYYDYDFFNRLIDVRDQDNNIVKRFCYNYAGQADNCANVGYGNVVKNGTFTSNATCPSGTNPATVSYSIAANTYYAADQPTADAMATSALNSQGQALANSLPCLAAITGTNTTGIPWNGTMTNISTNVSYTFSIYPAYNATFLVNVPAGTYNINISPYTTQTSPLNLTINGITYSGTTFNLTNISVSSATDIKLANPTGSGSCTVNMASGFSSPTSGLGSNGTAVSGYLVFYSNSTMSQGNAYQIGTISGLCHPSASRSFSTSSGGKNWTVTVATNGTISVQLAYGSAPVTAGTTVNLSISFTL